METAQRQQVAGKQEKLVTSIDGIERQHRCYRRAGCQRRRCSAETPRNQRSSLIYQRYHQHRPPSELVSCTGTVVVRPIPVYLANDINLIADSGCRLLRSAFARTCVIPRTHKSFGDRSFAAAVRCVWNSLLSCLRQNISYAATCCPSVLHTTAPAEFLRFRARLYIIQRCESIHRRAAEQHAEWPPTWRHHCSLVLDVLTSQQLLSSISNTTNDVVVFQHNNASAHSA